MGMNSISSDSDLCATERNRRKKTYNHVISYVRALCEKVKEIVMEESNVQVNWRRENKANGMEWVSIQACT
ncbi:hypothetical protein TorRG33x02_203350 [Trema orientale]|uniref:Uncharacterized protein n=1 Tax=Trema orientale TaxID=63057 RepID=A0A2P5EEC5_TREOI|nr:hypothetical protein TorRG33x02_203350 [Trema orientale]